MADTTNPLILSLGLLLAPLWGGQSTTAVDRFGGLNDSDAPAVIDSAQSPSLLNVEANQTGTAVKKRGGFTREAALLIATSPVSGSFEFKCDNGDQVRVVCHDQYCHKSTNGAAFTAFLSTAGVGITRWSFVSVDGDLYGANDARDPIFKYDCTTLTSPPEIPAGAVLALTEDRLVVADTSANPNRISYSKSGDFSEFTTGSASVDPFTDDIGAPGDRTTGIVYSNGILWIFRTQSILACETGDQYTTDCNIFSPNIGTGDPNSIVVANGSIYFRGQDRAYWRIGRDGTLDTISRRISRFTSNQLAGAQRSNTQTTQFDWDAGSESPSGSWDSQTNAGSVFPSSVTATDSAYSDFNSGTFSFVSTNTTPSIFMTASTTGTFLWENWSDRVFTGSPSWTENDTDWRIGVLNTDLNVHPTDAGKTVACRSENTSDPADESSALYATGGAPTGQWEVVVYTRNDLSTAIKVLMFEFLRQDSSNAMWLDVTRTSLGLHNIALKQKISGTTTQLGGTSSWTSPSATVTTFKIVRDTNAYTTVYRNGTSIIASTSSTSFFPLNSSLYIASEGTDGSGDCSGPQVAISSVSIPFYVNGVFFSRTLDTTFSSPLGGPITVSSTVPNGTELAFQVRSSNDGSTDWTSWATITNGARITQSRRYEQYLSSMTTSISTQTPVITQVSLAAASTGQFTTHCVEPGPNISSWGIISCDFTTEGNGSVSIAIATATSCSNLDSSSYYARTNNATITGEVGAAIKVRLTSLLGSTTDQAQANACTTYWNEGTVAQPVWGAFDSVNQAIYWTATTTAATQGDRVVKYDPQTGEWFPFDLRATALGYYSNNLYFGSSTGGYWNKYGAQGINTDNGADINAYWKSKDFGGNDPFVEKDWTRVSILARNNVTGSMTGTTTDSFNKTGTWTISLSTSTNINYIRSNYAPQKRSPSNFFNVQFGNNSSTPFEVLGIRIDANEQPWKVSNP